MGSFNLVVACLVVICGYPVLAQLSLFCYECKATDGNCDNYTTAASYNCYDQLGDFTDGVAVTCYSAFINYSGIVDITGATRDHETGVYRECGIIPEYLGDYCDWYAAELALVNIPLVSCAWCNESRCNNHTFDLETGLITGYAEDGANTSMLSFVLLGFSICLMCVLK